MTSTPARQDSPRWPCSIAFTTCASSSGQPVDNVALDTLTTMLYRALFDPNA